MALQTPVDREFAVVARGWLRDRVVLANFREGLRQLLNPETGLPFTESEIQRATQPKSRWYNEAQAIDDYGQSEQRRAIYLADCLRIDRAPTKWLVDFHGRMWGESLLPATGGSGSVLVRGVSGTSVVGSTTLGDPTAHRARDDAGNMYQVLTGATVGADGTVSVQMMATGSGSATNPTEGTTLTWTLRDPSMEPQATVSADFSGGTDRETDAEFASRLLARIRHAQGAGNDSQTRGWTRKSSNAVEDAFVYPCAFHAGSTLIAITQKRGNAVGPLGRFPSAGTLAAAIAHMTPPASAVYPTPPFVLVTPPVSQPANVVLRLEMARGSLSGWTDARPFPSYHAITPYVSAVTSLTDFVITCPGDATLPGQLAGTTLSGANAPAMMLWDRATSRYVRIMATSVQDLGGNTFRVLCSGPVPALSVGFVICPDMARRDTVARAVEGYFDALGPGEVIDATGDVRGGRCVRFPLASEEKPFRAGALVATRVIEALGGSSSDAALASLSRTTPDYPAVLTAGPNMITLGTCGLYSL